MQRAAVGLRVDCGSWDSNRCSLMSLLRLLSKQVSRPASSSCLFFFFLYCRRSFLSTCPTSSSRNTHSPHDRTSETQSSLSLCTCAASSCNPFYTHSPFCLLLLHVVSRTLDDYPPPQSVQTIFVTCNLIKISFLSSVLEAVQVNEKLFYF